MIRLVLPWPPSANNSKMPITVRSSKTGKRVQRQVSTHELKTYKRAVMRIVALSCAHQVSGQVRVRIDVQEPDRRRRDIANIEKAPIDALVDAGVIEDDCLIDDLRIVRHRGFPTPGGRVVVTISQIDCAQPDNLPNMRCSILPVISEAGPHGAGQGRSPTPPAEFGRTPNAKG